MKGIEEVTGSTFVIRDTKRAKSERGSKDSEHFRMNTARKIREKSKRIHII
jgi:hypothetical protein